MRPSYFRQLASTITVGDVCSPIPGVFDADRPVADVDDEWSVALCFEQGKDPMEQIALVRSGNATVGWVGYDMLESDKTIMECSEPISPGSIVSSDTPVLEMVEPFSRPTPWFYFVLRGSQFVGSLSYNDLHKLPFRLCLFTLLLGLEQMALEILQLTAQNAVDKLSDGKREKAEERYDQRGYERGKSGECYPYRLLECLSFIDKLDLLRKLGYNKSAVPCLNSKNRITANELRNELAHPGAEERSSAILSRERLWGFIQWVEELESEMGDHLYAPRAAARQTAG